MSPTGVDAVDAALSHGPDQGLQSVLGDCLPLLLQIPEQEVEVGWRRVVGVESTPQNVPHMFNGVQIG